MMKYLLGQYDFYKIVKENGILSLQSFNLHGTLKWGNRLPVPQEIIRIKMKPRSTTTALAVFDRGWQLSFRIHNARSRGRAFLQV